MHLFRWKLYRLYFDKCLKSLFLDVKERLHLILDLFQVLFIAMLAEFETNCIQSLVIRHSTLSKSLYHNYFCTLCLVISKIAFTSTSPNILFIMPLPVVIYILIFSLCALNIIILRQVGVNKSVRILFAYTFVNI